MAADVIATERAPRDVASLAERRRRTEHAGKTRHRRLELVARRGRPLVPAELEVDRAPGDAAVPEHSAHRAGWLGFALASFDRLDDTRGEDHSVEQRIRREAV